MKLGAGGVWYLLQPRGNALVNKKQLLTAGDHYTKGSAGHAAAAILPEDGNGFGTAFGAFVPLILSPSLLLPLSKLLQAEPASERGDSPWTKASLRVGV